MPAKKQSSQLKPKKSSRHKYIASRNSPLLRKNRLVLASFVLFFAITGAYYVFASKAETQYTKDRVVPFIEVKEKGLSWAGINKPSKTSKCKQGYDLVDKKGDLMGCTHGPDPAPEGINVTEAYDVVNYSGLSTLRDEAGIPCIGDGVSGHRVQAIYVSASDSADRYSTVSMNIPIWAGNMQDAVIKSARQTGGERYIRFVTNPDCTLNIKKVVVSPTGDDSFDNLVSELKTQGYNATDRSYLVWFDDNPNDTYGLCGMSYLYGDDRDNGDQNLSNTNAMYSAIGPSCWGLSSEGSHSSELHELMHNLGAVSSSAPHATASGHCTDDFDVMCYADSQYMTYPCVIGDITTTSFTSQNSAQEWLLDCNKDDYFNTNPAPGSYLDTHYNTADSPYFAKQLFAGNSNGNDVTPPTTPTNFIAKAPDITKVNLSWSPSTDTGGSGLAGYYIYKGGSLLAKVNGGQTSYTDTDIYQYSPYYDYYIVAFDNDINKSAKSPTVRVYISGVAPAVPDTTSPVIETFTPSDGSKLSKRTTVNMYASDNVSMKSVYVEIDGIIRASANSNALNWTWNTSKTLTGPHTVRFVASDTSGNISSKTITVNK